MRKQKKHLISKLLILILIGIGIYVSVVPMKAPVKQVEKTLPTSVLKN